MSQAPLENTKADVRPDTGTLPLMTYLHRSQTTTTITPIGDKIDDRLWPPRSAPNEESQADSGFVDSSGPIFSMYMEMAEEEDKKLAESWQADADGILIFVRLYFLVPCLTPAHSSILDWFILCRRRIVYIGVDSGPSTEPTRHIQLLPREFISGYYCRPKSIQYFGFPSHHPTPILSTHVFRLGQFTLVLELSHQYFLCSPSDVTTAMGTKISQGHADTLQSAQASSDTFVLC